MLNYIITGGSVTSHAIEGFHQGPTQRLMVLQEGIGFQHSQEETYETNEEETAN
jgi:hypothetical protein